MKAQSRLLNDANGDATPFAIFAYKIWSLETSLRALPRADDYGKARMRVGEAYDRMADAAIAAFGRCLPEVAQLGPALAVMLASPERDKARHAADEAAALLIAIATRTVGLLGRRMPEGMKANAHSAVAVLVHAIDLRQDCEQRAARKHPI